MAELNYTKGEWKIAELHGGERNILAVDEAGYPIEIICRDVRHYNMNLIKASPDMYEALKEADIVICEMCKRLNPQHATADYGKGCKWCEDREPRLNALAKAEGK